MVTAAARGQLLAEEVTVALKMVLQLEGIQCRSRAGRPNLSCMCDAFIAAIKAF
jgi:hypothetical protein